MTITKKAVAFWQGNPVFRQRAGVFGESDQQGVFGHSTSDRGTGVFGNSKGNGFGVRGEATTGIAIQGQCFGAGWAGRFIGDVDVTGRLFIQGKELLPFIYELQASYAQLLQRIVSLEKKQTAQGGGTPTSPPPPTINSVTKSTGGFDVKGFGFLKSHVVHVRVHNESNNSDSFLNFTSDSTGALNASVPNLGVSCGTVLDFSANDERPDSNITGVLWSNTFKITV